MAIWQFDISFIERGGPSPQRTDDGHEVPSLTAERTKQANAWLNVMFGPPWEMIDCWYVFGEEVGNRVDLLTNPDESSELSARIDLRGDPSTFITNICELASIVDCAFFSAELWSHIEPAPSDIAQAIGASHASAYVQNPLGFLREIAGGA